jgi:hypothetical protein
MISMEYSIVVGLEVFEKSFHDVLASLRSMSRTIPR